MCMLIQSWLGSNQDPLDSTRASRVPQGLEGSQERRLFEEPRERRERLGLQEQQAALVPRVRQACRGSRANGVSLDGLVTQDTREPQDSRGCQSSVQKAQEASRVTRGPRASEGCREFKASEGCKVFRENVEFKESVAYKACKASTASMAARAKQGLLGPKATRALREQTVQSPGQLDGLDLPGLPRPSLVPGGLIV